MVNGPESFAAWFKDQLLARNWGVRDAARAIGVSHPTVSEILSGRQPSFESCVLIARAFDVAPMGVFVKAGLLPENPDDATFEDWKFVLSQLSPRDRKELLEFARLKLRLQEAELRGRNEPHVSEG